MDLRERLASLVKEHTSLIKKKAQFSKDIEKNEALAKELRERAQQCARSNRLETAQLAEYAKAAVYLPQRQNTQKRMTSNCAPIHLMQRSERKLELTLQIRELEATMKGVRGEAMKWEQRASDARERLGRAEQVLQAVPRRYKESPIELQRELIELLDKRRALELALAEAQAQGGARVDRLRHDLNVLRRQLIETSDDMVEARREADHWQQLLQAEMAHIEPMRERVGKLKAELIASHGTDGLLIAALEVLSPEGSSALPVESIGRAITNFLDPEFENGGLGDAEGGKIRRSLVELGFEKKINVELGDLKRVLAHLGVSER